jgi:hypothetical protein
MNFLVTGGAGFIGSHVCERLLRDGHRVWAFDDLNDFYDPQFKRRNLREIQSLALPFEFCHGDLTDRAALDELFSSVKFDQVIHLAARAVATNVYLRRIHHFAVALHWLPWPVLPKLHWPPIKFEHKRAIILDEHRKLIAHEPDPVRRAYYELLWHFGGSQTDMALGYARQHSHHGLRDRRPHVLTNHFGLPALTVSRLYCLRWRVELFFKWIKQPLRIKAFYGTSPNAVRTQL